MFNKNQFTHFLEVAFDGETPLYSRNRVNCFYNDTKEIMEIMEQNEQYIS